MGTQNRYIHPVQKHHFTLVFISKQSQKPLIIRLLQFKIMLNKSSFFY